MLTSRNIKAVSRTWTLGDVTAVVTDYALATYGADDQVYAQDRELQYHLPRGRTTVVVTREGESKIETEPQAMSKTVELFGMRKFGAETDVFGYPLETDEEDVTEIYTTKENGECFHVTGFTFADQFFWLLGSKNVHGLLRDSAYDADLLMYTEDRFGFFREMAVIFRDLRSPGLQSFLDSTGWTLIGECLNQKHQHLVAYDQNDIRFFGMTRLDYPGWCLSPVEARSQFQQLGLPTVDRLEVVSLTDEVRREEIRSSFFTQENSEGAVVYVIARRAGSTEGRREEATEGRREGASATERVRRLYKFKNAEYVLRRAMREIIKRRGTLADVTRRLTAMNKEQFPVSEDQVKKCQALVSWFYRTYPDLKDPSDQWVTLTQPFDQVTDYDGLITTFAFSSPTSQRQLAFLAPPGAGKSTLARALTQLIGGVYCNQDEYGANRKKYHQACRKFSTDPSCPVLIFDKSNHTQRIRDQLLEAIQVQDLTWLEIYHPDGLPALLELCLQRIETRGDGHLSLFPGLQTENIVRSTFGAQWEPLTAGEQVIRIDVTLSPVEMLRVLTTALGLTVTEEQLASAIATALAYETRLRESRRVEYWSLDLPAEPILSHPTISTFLAEHPEYQVLRDVHCTLLFVGKTDRDQSVYRALAGQTKSVTVTSLCYDGRAVALRVTPNCPVDNEHPHVTVALARGVRAEYSNTMLKGQPVEVEMALKVEGQVTSH